MAQALFSEVGAHDYGDAVQHYLSPDRRDEVKAQWEETMSRRIYATAIRAIGDQKKGPVNVLDIGCGTGDGWHLLQPLGPSSGSPTTSRVLNYYGIDIDPSMIEAARYVFKDTPGVQFEQVDVRTGIPDEPFDLYLSCGVPYSHLTQEELVSVLARIFSEIRRHAARAAVVVDVLGQYSIEWVPKWGQSRWDYRMSFFVTDAEMKPTYMTFYSARSLNVGAHLNSP